MQQTPPPTLDKPRAANNSAHPKECGTAESYLSKMLRLRSQDQCGRGSIIGYNPERTKLLIIPVTCKSWDCEVCGPRKRKRWIAKLAAGAPQRTFTLTSPPIPGLSSRQMAVQLRKSVTRLLKCLRDRDPSFSYALVWEVQENGTPHCHVLQRGRYIPQKYLSRKSVQFGLGPNVWISAVHDFHLAAAHSAKYVGKHCGQTAALLAPFRIIQISKNWVIKENLPKPHPKLTGYLWTFSPRSPESIIKHLSDGPDSGEAVPFEDGSTGIYWTDGPPAFELIPMDKGPFYDIEITRIAAAFGFPPTQPTFQMDCPAHALPHGNV